MKPRRLRHLASGGLQGIFHAINLKEPKLQLACTQGKVGAMGSPQSKQKCEGTECGVIQSAEHSHTVFLRQEVTPAGRAGSLKLLFSGPMTYPSDFQTLFYPLIYTIKGIHIQGILSYTYFPGNWLLIHTFLSYSRNRIRM